MNYTTDGIKKRIHQLDSKTDKIKKMLLLYLLKGFLIAVVGVFIVCAAAGIGAFRGILSSTPEVALDDLMPNGYATIVYDTDGNAIQKLVAEASNRTYVQMELIPEDLAHAFVAIEDERYYTHNGIDVQSIFRAAAIGVANGFHFSQGGSTITQQLLKNNVFTDWMAEDSFIDSVKRKIQEQYLAIEVSKVYDKDTLLCLYMNTINLGSNTLGVQAASLKYFGKNVQDLTLSECAVIASITQNPSKWNPITHPENNRERRGLVLSLMLEQGYISEAQYAEAIADSDDVYARITTVNTETETASVQSYFTDALIRQLTKDLKDIGYTDREAYNILYSSGAKVYSTMDSKIQAICDEVIADESLYPENSTWYLSEYRLTVQKADKTYANYSAQMLETYFKASNAKYNRIYKTQEEAYEDIEIYVASILEEGDEVYDQYVSITPQPQISLVIEDQNTGYVIAMVGGRGPKTASATLNRATDSYRQPGSTFKIVSTYAPGLDSGLLTLASVQTDAPFNYEDGTPVSNWWTNGTYKGICSVRYAIEQSLNIIAVKNLTVITPQLGYDYLQEFGFTTLTDGVYINGSYHTDVIQALSLGGITFGVKNIELNAAYATIANGGEYIEPILYTQLVSSDGDIILDNTNPTTRQVLRPTTAYLLTNAMTDVVTIGTGGAVRFPNMAIAGKTGTTSKNVDFWFAGFTPYYTCTVWGGYDNNEKMSSKAEQNFHKRIWKGVMERVHAELPYKNFSMPANIVTCQVCKDSGLLPSAKCVNIRTEYFEKGTEPTEYCNSHYEGWVCAIDLKPATEDCPFAVPGSITLDPPLHENLVQGATVIDANGNIVSTPSSYCRHTAEYLTNPATSPLVQSQYNMLSQDMQAAVKLHHPDVWGH